MKIDHFYQHFFKRVVEAIDGIFKVQEYVNNMAPTGFDDTSDIINDTELKAKWLKTICHYFSAVRERVILVQPQHSNPKTLTPIIIQYKTRDNLINLGKYLHVY